MTPTPQPFSLQQLNMPPLTVDLPVHVNRGPEWLSAVVTSIASTRVGVAVFTGGPRPWNTVVAPWTVRPAAGIRLRRVHRVTGTDEVVDYDGSVRTVAAPPQLGRAGWWLIPYTDGDFAALPPRAVVRLREVTPQVTLNGRPLGC